MGWSYLSVSVQLVTPTELVACQKWSVEKRRLLWFILITTSRQQTSPDFGGKWNFNIQLLPNFFIFFFLFFAWFNYLSSNRFNLLINLHNYYLSLSLFHASVPEWCYVAHSPSRPNIGSACSRRIFAHSASWPLQVETLPPREAGRLVESRQSVQIESLALPSFLNQTHSHTQHEQHFK